jgi:hypothetical protein
MECGRVKTDAKVSKPGSSTANAAIKKEFSYFPAKHWQADADIVSYSQINRHHLLQEADMAVFPVT